MNEGLQGKIYRRLNPNQIKQVSDTSMELLGKIGVMVEDEGTLKLLDSKGLKPENKRIKLSRSLVEDLITEAPSEFTLCGRKQEHDLLMSSKEKRVYFGTGGTATEMLYFDILGKLKRKPPTCKDLEELARLTEHLEHVDFFHRPVEPSDVSPDKVHTRKFYIALSNTTKHIQASAGDVENAEKIKQMAELVTGKPIAEKPIISFVACGSVSPMSTHPNSLQILRYSAQNKIPLSLSSCPQAGATAPSSEAGILAQVNAEVLFLLCLSQLTNKGAPVLYGAVPWAFDMRSSVNTSSPDAVNFSTAISQLAHYYRIPCYNTAGLTESQVPGMQTMMEKTYSLLMVGLSGAQYIHDAVGILGSTKLALREQYIIDNEILARVKQLIRKPKVNKKELDEARNSIERVIDNENMFLMDPYTFQTFRDELYLSPTLPNEASNSDYLNYLGQASKKVDELLSQGIEPLPEKIDKELRKLL